MKRKSADLLVAGGTADANLVALVEAVRARGLSVHALLFGDGEAPACDWDPARREFRVDGKAIEPRAAFLRADVFGPMASKRALASYRANAWYEAIAAWLLVRSDIRVLNRASLRWHTAKPHVLALARDCGLSVPRTRVTNDLAGLARARKGAWIVKPIGGGDHTRTLEETLAGARGADFGFSGPAIVQERLVPPELRVFCIDGRHVAFEVISPDLDYRVDPKPRLVPRTTPPALARGLDRLMARLGMDWGAADFKADPRTGALKFLEINSNPMFWGFDRAGKGSVRAALIDALCGPK
ncbi:MAG: hypothetical protein NBV67_17450 [Tagaea sp.]|nr:hypothetical protein [Tagaea sp.]